MPSFYITINPADTHNPVVKFLAGGNIDIDKMLEDEIPNVWEQSLLVSSNPVIAARFFNLYLKAFLRSMLGCSAEELNVDGGILGTVKAHYGCVEAQGRGSLHCHMLVWIEGSLNPNEICEKVMRDTDWGRNLLRYLDDTISNVVLEDPAPDVRNRFDDKDPCTLQGADLSVEDIQLRLASRTKDISRLVERVQRHRYTHTCYKHYKPGETRSCRFDLSEDNFRAESAIDPETGCIRLRCLDGLVNNFNMTMLEAVRCNMDIQFIGSGESAKAMIYYVTDYITKSQLKSHVAYAALQLAVKKYEAINGEEKDFIMKSKRLLQKCAYALVSHQEVSAQQVVSYLMDYEDHFTSHDFNNLYWASFERFVDRDDPMGGTKDSNPKEVMEDEDDTNPNDETQESLNDEDQPVECDSLEVVDEEEVAVTIDKEGGVVEIANQVSDYTMRPNEVSELCLWDFMAKTEKVRGSVKRQQMGEANFATDDDVSDEEEWIEVLDVDSEECDVAEKQNRGRKKIAGYKFQEGHKECNRKVLRLRGCEVVPVPIGPAMPRRDDKENHERYCRVMVILFRPWHVASDLRRAGSSWEEEYKEFESELTARHKGIMDNMQILHECRDSRDDHMQTRSRERGRTVKDGICGDGQKPENKLEEVDMAEVLKQLGELERMSSKKTETTNRDTQ